MKSGWQSGAVSTDARVQQAKRHAATNAAGRTDVAG